MKGNKILGIIWLIIAVVLIFVLIGSLKKGKITFKEAFNLPEIINVSSEKLFDTYDFTVDEINDIEVNLKSETIFFEKNNNPLVSVELYCTEKTAPKVYTDRKTLNIDGTGKSGWGNRKVVVKIPDNFETFYKIKTLSGSIKFNENITAKSITCDSASGSIKFSGSADSVKLCSLSGSIKINNSSVKNLNVSSKSGSVSLNGSFDSIDISTLSGSIDITLFDGLQNNSLISAKSGSINVKLPLSSDLLINYKCSSGSYKNRHTGESGKKGKDKMGNGTNNLSIETLSGNIRIE